MDARAEELFRNVARLLAEPILGVSPDGVLLLSCPAAQRLLARADDALRGHSLAEFAAGPPNKVLDYVRLCARSLSPLPGSIDIIDGAGTTIPCRCKGALLSPAQKDTPIVVLRLAAKAGTQSPFALLNQKIADLTSEVMNRKRAEQEALQAIEMRDEFLAVASHEFKTPLQSLLLQLELVARVLGTLDAFTLKRTAPRLETMRRQVDRLTTLSQRLLDLSAIRSGHTALQLQRHEVADVVRASVEGMVNELARARCVVRLNLQKGLDVLVDASRLEQILVNLLSNAAKYGAGGPITVSVSAQGDSVTVAVSDAGIGISEEDLPRIFGKFERAVSAENYGGLGLGLFISRQLAEAMGGQLRAESKLGQGSTFTIEFKRAPLPPFAVQQ